MLLKLLEKIFGTASQRQINKIMPLLTAVHDAEEAFENLPTDELRDITNVFRREIAATTMELHKEVIAIDKEITDCDDADEVEELRNERKKKLDELFRVEQDALDAIMPRAFAGIRETCRRLVGSEFDVLGSKFVWDMIPYDVQLLGGIILHKGKISEMATGEGKTLVATFPLYLNALALNHDWVVLAMQNWGDDPEKWQFGLFVNDATGATVSPGRGVHLITVNDYLARRDATWMGQIYSFLGLTVGVVHEGIEPYSQLRKAQYAADITYGTDNAFGFDYLRDNLARRPEEVVQREHFFSIVDEVDSVLIDEARTPLIMSGPVESNISEQFKRWNSAVKHLVSQQAKQSASNLNTGTMKWKRATDLESEGKGSEANKLRDEAAYELLLVKRSTPKNPQFLKLIKEPEILKAVNHLEATFRANKDLHTVDEKLYYAVDEHDSSINLTDKGRDELGRFSGMDREVFTLPDVADMLSQLDNRDDLDEKDKAELKEKAYKEYAERAEINHAMTQLLKAYIMFAKDVDYVVQDNKVVIVDEFTGRLMPGRRFSEGLHQALEAKEGVHVEGETQTFATITLQNYFRMYRKLAGMTGTAMTESSEFFEIYKLDVVSIPTNRPVRRVDYNDRIYLTKNDKFQAVIDEIEVFHKRGQPVLVGTVSVEISELLARMLGRKKINCQVLNAKNHQGEAEIVMRAGQPYAVTIATNMAGRGTDIKLGVGIVKSYELVYTPKLEQIAREVAEGKSFLLVTETEEVLRNLESICKDMRIEAKNFNLRESTVENISKYLAEGGHVALFSGFGLAEIIPEGNFEVREFPKPICKLNKKAEGEWVCTANAAECMKLGVPCGLHIIGTERHESRRIDNQLRGRAGRQGDPGASRFFLSLQDDLMRLYAGGDRAFSMIKRLNPPEGEPIEHKFITKQIATAQKRVESQNFSIRKHLLEYDNVTNMQREIVYAIRRNILWGANLKPDYRRLIREFTEDLVTEYTDPKAPPESWNWTDLQSSFANTFLLRYDPNAKDLPDVSLAEQLEHLGWKAYEMKESFVGTDVCRALERWAMLGTIDKLWMDHLRAIDEIKEGSHLASYAQKDPLVTYKKEAFDAFERLMDEFRREVLMRFFHAQVVMPTKSHRMTNIRTQHTGTSSYGAQTANTMAQKTLAKSPEGEAPENGDDDTPLPGQSGKQAPVRVEKIGRNEPCPCGSGKKYKQCCGKR